MNSSVSNFFSRDAMLKRQARTFRKAHASLSTSSPLNIIIEEDESRASSSRSPSPMPAVKAKRRRANVSDIRIARDAPVHDDNDLSPHDANFLAAPRPAPRPRSSPSASPDSFQSTFNEISSKFPHPPTPSFYDRSECASPTRSSSSLSSSPCSHSEGLPLTPSTSDDEFPASARALHPIQPLVIHKHNPRATSPYEEISLSPSLLQPFKTSSENVAEAPLSPLSPSFLGDESSNDSEPESDSEWYTREFSKIISLRSPIPPSFPLQHARPESMSIPSDFVIAPAPASRRRVSKALPPTPLSPASSKRDSAQAEAPHRRNSKTRSIPKYPPPPVPPIPAHLRSNSMSSIGSMPTSPTPASPLCNKTLPQNLRRPPPRFSVPDDCVFDLYMESEDGGDARSDASSEFSFTMYEVNFGERERQESPASVYSQPSYEEQEFPVEDIRFELDYTLMLPLSLPGTPIDLEADIALGLERLRSREEETLFEEAEFVIEAEEAHLPAQELQPLPQPVTPASSVSSHEIVNDMFSPTCSSFSFSPSPSPANSFTQQQYAYYPSSTSPANGPYTYANEEKMLKSKWSTSTLGSIREEHERRGPSSKLRLYFGGNSPIKGSKRTSGSSKKVPPTPTSPFGLMSPRKTSRSLSATHSPSASPSPPARQQHHHHRGSSTNSNSDVVVIGYGASGVGVRRRGSLATVSDAGSESSADSSSSSGLRRKPIPVEMFLRSGV